MAKSRKKNQTIGLINKLKNKNVVAAIIVAMLALTAFVLDKTGILPLNKIEVMLGIADKPIVAAKADTQVHFIDVGQGDCTFVVSDEATMLVDSGDRDNTNAAITYLEKQGVEKLDVIVITHPHADHIGEMSEIIDTFEVSKVIMLKNPDKLTPTSKIYEDMLKSIKVKGIKITSAKDESFELGSATVELFTPKGDYSDLNNYSVLVKIIHGDNSFLVTGDCEAGEEKDMLSQGFDLSAKVLKAGHHGSSTSNSRDFLEEVAPRYTVISCGLNNKYNHPNDETIARIKKYAENLYLTPENGDIVFVSDGKGLEVNLLKGD